EMPNRVMEGLYFDFFYAKLLEESQLTREDLQLPRRVAALALQDDMQPVVEALTEVLGRLSNRDARGWTEHHVKAVLMALLVPTGVYGVFSEWPVGQGYVDIALLRRPPILEPKHEHLIELKYVKKEDAKRLEVVKEEGRQQLRQRLAHPDVVRRGGVLGWLITVVGYEAQAEQVQ
ncbi:MAG: PD-(D/E)XK nuclease domain-containing protein, partial [Saprospiraceae bacterium]|nr:PD-(D/E)XK nuclease domain-containing protein [Saprospiraceae bacterium]